MKKSLIALAVLAASGAAMAQSTVTLYGVADVWVGQTKATAANGTSLSQNAMGSGGVNGSRWGLKGSEDLGAGLKANFQIESGYDISNGANLQGALFGRQAYVGLSGGFGAVTLGRQYTAYDALRGGTDHIYDSAIAVQGGTWAKGAVADYTGRANNAIMYTSPNMGGVTAAVQYALGEDKTATTGASNILSLNVTYANGPVKVGVAHQKEKINQATNTFGAGLTSPNSRSYTEVAGTYDMGVVAFQAGLNQAKLGSAKDTEMQFGVSAPIGTSASIAAGYASTKGKVNGVTTAKGTGFGVAGYYSLSKRTIVYAGLNQIKGKTGAGVSTGKDSLVAVGVRHLF